MRCPKCRAEVEEDAVFCINCGIEIESYLKWSPDYQEKPKKNFVSQSAEQKNIEKPEKLSDKKSEEIENIEEPKPEKSENTDIEKLKPEKSENLQKPNRK